MDAVSPSNSLALQFRDVTYRVRGQAIISQLNLEVSQGEMLVLLGQSGSGKTTVLKLINQLISASQGDIFVENVSVKEWHPIKLRRRIGYVIQEVGLFPHLTVEQNIGIIPSLENWERDRIAQRVKELLELVGLEPQSFAKRYPYQLSGGQKQRVGVARALAANPPILLMDEPFAALDLLNRLELQRELRSLQQNLKKTIIFVTHDIQEAFFLADRIGVMDQGRLVELCPKSQFAQSQVPEVKLFLESLQELNRSLNNSFLL